MVKIIITPTNGGANEITQMGFKDQNPNSLRWATEQDATCATMQSLPD